MAPGVGVGQDQATPWPRGEGPRATHVTRLVCPAPTSGHEQCTKAGTPIRLVDSSVSQTFCGKYQVAPNRPSEKVSVRSQ